jgi:hypothetical protein
LGGIGNVITNTLVRSLRKKAIGKPSKSAGSLAGKKTGGNKKKGAARGKDVQKPYNELRKV